MHHLFRTSQIHVGMFKNAESKLQFENPSHRAVDKRFGNRAALDTLNQKPHISWLVGNVHIHAGLQRHLSGLLLIPSYVFIDDGIEAAAFALNDALEAEFMAKDVSIPFLRRVDRKSTR